MPARSSPFLWCLPLAVALWAYACTDPGHPPPPGDDAGEDAGDGLDAGGPVVAPVGQWTWIPVEGSQCASGSTTGFAINVADAGQDLFIFMQGGGACWNTGTCVPSLVQYGPVCNYGSGICLYNGAGGTQPTAVHVTESDPFPRDGGGALPGELAQIKTIRALDRTDPSNPFRDATFVFVPYCTGDLHAGRSEQTYPYRYGAFDPVSYYTVHFAGAMNTALFLRKLHLTLPGARRVWLSGSSAGGYGATLSFERTRREFAGADVALLADSAPFLPTYHWGEFTTAWNSELPAGCPDCDAGMPQLINHLLATYPTSRLGLLAYDHDNVISWYFYGAAGVNDFVSPPTGAYNADLGVLEQAYDGTANGKYYVLAGTTHVMWPGYGTRLADGGYTAPVASNDGGTDLKRWIDAWATGGPGWTSTR